MNNRMVVGAHNGVRGYVPETHTVSEVARRLGVRPRDISDLFYARKLSDEVCTVRKGRRRIPSDYLPTIIAALKENGLWPRGK